MNLSLAVSFLNNLFNDPKYQTTDPRQPEQIDDPEIIISPDTRREKRIPQGQSRTKSGRCWTHGAPGIDLATWQFDVGGLVEKALRWSPTSSQLPVVRVYADFHCVTRWSRLDNVWSGVSTREIAKLAGVKPDAKFVVAAAYDFGWTTNVPIEYFLKEDSLFAWAHDGQPIPPEHGGPVRLIIPQLYA
jgi:DMSO/TMAO reductase YedYZ molybdopterin-dependent catalytic subunit